MFKEIFPEHANDIVLTEIQVQNKSSFNKNLMKKYNVELVPTIILVDSKGNIVDRIEGAIPKDVMQDKLRNLK
ncbi:thioredoxin fold domain-containing protein [bacterium]|nr:thioredoxin fold domain-containing protein [bacterium]